MTAELYPTISRRRAYGIAGARGIALPLTFSSPPGGTRIVLGVPSRERLRSALALILHKKAFDRKI